RKLGAEIREASTLTSIEKSDGGWKLTIAETTTAFRVRVLVAADGRNSTVARLLGLLPRFAKERVALQTHIPLPSGFGNRVVLQLLVGGYSGQAPVNDSELNLCLVGKPKSFTGACRSEEHTSELQSRGQLVCRLLLEKKNEEAFDRLHF